MDSRVNPVSERSEIVYEAAPVFRAEHGESRTTRLVEQQSAKMSSVVFLAAALAAMSASLLLELTGRRRASRFIGMWPGPLLTMGVYNKLVKTFGAR
jgi:limonene-1,2-epoxide hydrolase